MSDKEVEEEIFHIGFVDILLAKENIFHDVCRIMKIDVTDRFAFIDDVITGKCEMLPELVRNVNGLFDVSNLKLFFNGKAEIKSKILLK